MASNPIHPLISGYVAARILDGIQTSIPTLETPEVNAYDVAEARDIWSRLNVEHQSALFLYLGGRQPLDPGRDNEMMGVLSRLKRYSLPLSIDVRLMHTRET